MACTGPHSAFMELRNNPSPSSGEHRAWQAMVPTYRLKRVLPASGQFQPIPRPRPRSGEWSVGWILVPTCCLSKAQLFMVQRTQSHVVWSALCGLTHLIVRMRTLWFQNYYWKHSELKSVTWAGRRGEGGLRAQPSFLRVLWLSWELSLQEKKTVFPQFRNLGIYLYETLPGAPGSASQFRPRVYNPEREGGVFVTNWETMPNKREATTLIKSLRKRMVRRCSQVIQGCVPWSHLSL